MNYSKLRIVGIAASGLLLAGSLAGVLSQTSPAPINISVNTLKRTSAKTAATPETLTEKLEIMLQNPPLQSYSNLTLRYCIFDKDVQSHKIAVAQKNEVAVTLPATAMLTITSEVASIHYTPTHEITVKQHTAKKGEPQPVKETAIKAEGKEFAGYGVEVLQASLVVGQLFSPLERTNQFNTAFSDSKKRNH